jgi:hypothetical protein
MQAGITLIVEMDDILLLYLSEWLLGSVVTSLHHS